MEYILIFLAVAVAVITLTVGGIVVKNMKKIKHSPREFINKRLPSHKIIKSYPPQPEESGDALILSDSDKAHVVGKKSNPLN
jgi:cell division protein FtsN